MKKMLMMMVAVLALFMLTGCSSTEATGSVATDGSTSMEKVFGALGEAFQNDTGKDQRTEDYITGRFG